MQRLDGVAALCASLCLLMLLLFVKSSHQLVDVTAGLHHLRLRLEKLTKQHRSLRGCAVRCAVSCFTLVMPIRAITLQIMYTHQSSLCKVAHQKTELGRLQQQQRSVGRAQGHSEDVRHTQQQLRRSLMIGAL